jgi:hypothetical protein
MMEFARDTPNQTSGSEIVKNNIYETLCFVEKAVA